MATLNVYLPDALKADMDSTEGINWSQVAQEAFRRAIQLERTKQVDMTQGQLERLRSTREHKADREEAEAVAAGKAWALNEADFEVLERIASIDTDDDAFDGEPSAHGWGAVLADAVFGEREWDRQMVEEFCEQYLIAAYPGGHQVRGFIDGAREVYDQV
ncbi:MAG: hypothetical protein WCY32_09650 [Burkholderiaceae bacterium]